MAKTVKTAKPAKLTLDEALRRIADMDIPLPAEAIYRLSDLNADDVKQLQGAWGGLPVERRRQLIVRLTEVSETDFDTDFTALARLALTDLDDQVRESAVEATWADETTDMATRLIAMASGDLAAPVRAAAVGALGRYILLDELGKFNADVGRRAQNMALKLHQDTAQDVNVRRRALEAIANCSREGVENLIEAAYADKNADMRASAIYAMGRSCDSRWEAIVLRELTNKDPQIRFEATRTAGELEMRKATPQLGKALHDDDREIMEMAVWSLGEIGGDEARRLLDEMMEEADHRGDDSLAEAIDEAMQSASLVGEDLVI
ncbi:MAG TPA: HEAT repeat domain-containing protein [Aggregatilineales bacterium]|nr:HEAT repeat domain-containing protein [Aggregatilineales bacterium]